MRLTLWRTRSGRLHPHPGHDVLRPRRLSAKHQERILSQCPDAADVRGVRAWLKTGRVVRKGQKGIKIVDPVLGDDGNAKVVNIKPAWVFDVTQTDERLKRLAALRLRAGREHSRPASLTTHDPFADESIGGQSLVCVVRRHNFSERASCCGLRVRRGG